jgi:hypothetical protein
MRNLGVVERTKNLSMLHPSEGGKNSGSYERSFGIILFMG